MERIRKGNKRSKKEKREIRGESNQLGSKKDWGREEEIEMNHQEVEGMVPKRFHWWLRVFRKIESERMLV